MVQSKVEQWDKKGVQCIFSFKFFFIRICIIIKFFRYLFFPKKELESHFFKVSLCFLHFFFFSFIYLKNMKLMGGTSTWYITNCKNNRIWAHYFPCVGGSTRKVIHKHETFHIALILNRLPFLMKVYILWLRIEIKSLEYKH